MTKYTITSKLQGIGGGLICNTVFADYIETENTTDFYVQVGEERDEYEDRMVFSISNDCLAWFSGEKI